MNADRYDRVTRRGFTVSGAMLLIGGCLGGSAELDPGQSERPEETSPAASTVTADSGNADPTESDDWNATVEITPRKASLAGDDYVYNGWNVSVEITSIDGADEVAYVYEAVNVQSGDSTREGTIGTEVGDRAGSALSLLQKGETVTVYAIKDGRRKRIGTHRVNSSYVSPWDGERGWTDSWRGEQPEG